MKLLNILFLFLFVNSLFAQERVGNGEGISEQRVTTINEYLPYYINICLKGGCQMSSSELDELKSLLDYRKNDPKLVFLSALKNPGIFDQSGILSNIQTTKIPTSEVKINLDKLYTGAQAINLDKALSLVISIYDYKRSQVSNPLLISKLMLALSQNISTVQHSFDYSYIKFSLFRENDPTLRTLFVNDDRESFNVGQNLLEYFKCTNKKYFSIQKVAWLDSLKEFSLILEGDNLCSLQHFKIQVNLNLKYEYSHSPGSIPRLILDETSIIRSVENL